jgi:hypothetical protein
MRNLLRSTRDTIVWTRSLDMESMSGRMDGYIKAILIMILGMDLVNYMKAVSLFIGVSGKVGSRLMRKL